MSKQIFIKILGSQESGYSGSTPNQRGKYILIPTEAWVAFPDLSEAVRNSFSGLRIYTSKDSVLGVLYVWHNTKLLPDPALLRQHNERRIYRTAALDEALSLDRETMVVMFRIGDDKAEWYATSLLQSSPSYGALKEHVLAGERSKLVTHDDLVRVAPDFAVKVNDVVNQIRNLSDEETPSLSNEVELITRIESDVSASTAAVTATLIHDDPMRALVANFKTQQEFQTAVFRVYEGKCALREEYLVSNSAVGLEAAHVHAKASGGNNLPTNGILLSADLHRAFDAGAWTLTDELVVKVHPGVRDGGIVQYHDKTLNVPQQHAIFRPYKGYLDWHRTNKFDKFQKP